MGALKISCPIGFLITLGKLPDMLRRVSLMLSFLSDALYLRDPPQCLWAPIAVILTWCVRAECTFMSWLDMRALS